jgi:hypothetical protein
MAGERRVTSGRSGAAATALASTSTASSFFPSCVRRSVSGGLHVAADYRHSWLQQSAPVGYNQWAGTTAVISAAASANRPAALYGVRPTCSKTIPLLPSSRNSWLLPGAASGRGAAFFCERAMSARVCALPTAATAVWSRPWIRQSRLLGKWSAQATEARHTTCR